MVQNDNDFRVLVLAPTGRDADAIVEVISRVHPASRSCRDLSEFVDLLHEGAGAAFIAEEALGTPSGSLETWISAQAPWSDLPFIVLTSRQSEAILASWRQALLVRLRNVTLLERPVQSITLISALTAALRSRARQYEVKQHLEARERATAELEQLVMARTHELQRANELLKKEMAERDTIADQLRHSQKMEAIGQLTGGVAHDFNNLLTVIAGGLSILERRPERRQETLDAIKKAIARGARLTRQLLAFSRRQNLKAEAIDVKLYFSGLTELLDRSLRGDVTVVTEIAPDVWSIIADPAELELVILNLAVNARDAMPNGGQIAITATNHTDGDGAHFVCISVRDRGTGMSPETLSKAFDPFFTTKNIGQGSGLGLAQVHGFVTQSGGRVAIQSAIGEGTTVSIFLPRSDLEPVAPKQRVPSQLTPRGKGHVLLVEDQDEVAQFVVEMLNELGYRVTRSATASAALDVLRTSEVDIVFSDIMMPGDMDGVQLSREIRNRYPHVPILLTSGYPEVIQRTAETAGVRILAKPYQIEELGAALTGLQSSHSVH